MQRDHRLSAAARGRSPFPILFGAVALALLLAACAGAAPPPRYPIREPSRILEVLRGRETRVRSLRARGSVDQFGRQGRVRGNVVIFVRQPDKLRVDTFAFGNLISSIVSDGTTLAMQQGSEYVVGPARACMAAQLLGMPLEAREVIAILSGGAPLISERVSAPRWENGRYVVDVTGEGDARERIEFELPDDQRELPIERQQPRVRRVELRDGQGVRADITYENYRVVGGVPFPDRVRLVMPRDHVDTQLRFDEVTPDFTVPPDPDDPDGPAADPFRHRAPAGIEARRIDC